MIALNKMGEAVEVTEQSPYDLSRVDKNIPGVSYVEVDTSFNPNKTFNTQKFNDKKELELRRANELRRKIDLERQIENTDVLEAYRMEIACDQSSDEISVSNVLLNKAFNERVLGPDFNQLEIANTTYRRDGFPSTDWSPILPGFRVGSEGNEPNSLPGRRDASNTNKEGQMSGYWGRSMALGDFWSDLVSQAETAIKQEVPKLVQTGTQMAVNAIQPAPPQNQYVVQSGVPIPTAQTMRTISSSFDPKVLMIGGAVVVGLILIIAVARR
jgi:hypothetical protein